MATGRWDLSETPLNLLEAAFERFAGQPSSPHLEPIFMELVRRCHSFLFKYILCKVRNSYDIEDLLQITLKKAFEYRSTYKCSSGSFRQWIFGIAHHTVINHFRALGRERENLSAWAGIAAGLPGSAVDPERAYMAENEYRDLLDSCKEERDKRLLEALIRRKFDGQSWSEIHRDMGWDIEPESLRIACIRLVKNLKRVR